MGFFDFMTEEIATADAEAGKISVDKTNISVTDFAQKQLGDIVSVELPSVGNEFKQNDAMAIIDSVKASSDIYCPIDGKVVAVNEELLQSPELINKSPFESGWIVKLEPSNISQLENLMAEEEYKKFVGED